MRQAAAGAVPDAEAAARRLVAIDIDGTVMGFGNTISPAVVDAIAAVRAVGHHVVLATGRSVISAAPIARRLGVRERTASGETRTAATLNGTLVSTRWVVPILENHQQADGSVRVPEGLRGYLGGLDVLRPVVA